MTQLIHPEPAKAEKSRYEDMSGELAYDPETGEYFKW